MPLIRIPIPLQAYVEGQKSVTVDGLTVNEVISNMTMSYPTIAQHIFDPEGRLRGFIKIFLEEKNRFVMVDRLDLPLKENDNLAIIASMAGG